MTRYLFTLLIFFSFALELAQAQVASPTLIPGFVTDNPAVIQWGAPSRIGAAWIDVDSEITDTPTGAVTTGESSGYLAGFRLVGDFISFAVQSAKLDGTQDTGVELEFSVTSAALAIPIGDSLTLGVGQEQVDIKLESTLPATLELDSTTPLAGVSLRLGGVLYLGAAAGKETLRAIQTVPAFPIFNFDVELERDVQRYGVALYDNEGVQWHLEIATMKRESTDDPATGIIIDETDETFGIIEVNAGGYLLGFRSKKLEESDDTVLPAVVNRVERSKEINLGWVPESGWALVFVATLTEKEEGTTTTEDTTAAVLFSFLF